LETKKGIVAFAFGVPATIFSNHCLANIALRQALRASSPIYTQADIQIEKGKGIEVCLIEEREGSPAPTLRIARGAVKWAIKKEITTLLIVAAEPHLWRCLRDVTEAIKEEKAQTQISVCACKELSCISEEKWFCSDSTQARTQSRKNWERRERILKVMPFWIYKHVAK